MNRGMGKRLPRAVSRPWAKTAGRALLGAFLFVQPLPARAHSVFIFAWAEGTRICTESYFSRNNRVRGGNVSMEDMQGNLLFSGQTGSDGTVCFDPPGEARDLKFVVLAGQGHRAEFVLPASEVENAVVLRGGAASAPAPANAAGGDAAPESGGQAAQAPSPAFPGLTAAEARALIREELQSQLAPIQRTLARDQERNGPELKDIIGGIGWILGIAALAARFGRKRRG
jgi:nickel transport protein